MTRNETRCPHSVERVEPVRAKIATRRPSVALQLADEIAGIDAERLGDLEHFNEVKPALAMLVFRDERLRPAELEGELRLADAPHPTRLDEPFT